MFSMKAHMNLHFTVALPPKCLIWLEAKTFTMGPSIPVLGFQVPITYDHWIFSITYNPITWLLGPFGICGGSRSVADGNFAWGTGKLLGAIS